MHFTPERFSKLWHELGLRPASEDLYAGLRDRYAEPHRAYHTAQHIDECLTQLDLIRDRCEHPGEVELALWFHDAFYDPQSSGNERRSAEWAASAIESAGASAGVVERVRGLILITEHDAVPTSSDEKLVVDIDLSILGAPRERFLEYEAQVRQEYSWVPDEIFQRERSKILQRFLDRSSIYFTDFFRDRLEAQARRNLK